MKIILCRHGQTELNSKGIVQGHSETSLSDKGREQSRKLAEALEKFDPDFLVSSSLNRSIQTAEIVGEKLGLENSPIEEFDEIERGVWEGEPADEMFEIVDSSDMERHLWTPEGGESFKDLTDRVDTGLGKLENIEGDTVVLIGHGGTNGAIIASALSCSPAAAIKMDQHNCCINSLWKHQEVGWVLEKMNDTCHLE